MASDMFMASIDAWFEQASQRLKGREVDGNNGMQTPAQKIAAARASRVMAGTSVPSASAQSTASVPQCRPEPKLDFAVSSVVRRFNDFKRDQEKKAHSKKFKGI